SRFSLPILLLFSATLCSLVTAGPTLTNAQRLRRGLPLKRPVFRDPSRTRRDTTASPIPGVYTGYIQVLKKSDDTLVGYYSKTYLLSKTRDDDDAMKVTFTTAAGS
ncbi:hypothetical protein DL96DRAFT_1620400, partial [Flagelloscypha sp. PMI_526]